MKQFEIVLSHILDTVVHEPKFVELLTHVGSAVRIVNEMPLVPLSDDPRVSLLLLQLHFQPLT